MKCLSPIAISGHSGTAFKQFLSPITYVPCGQCIACRLNYGKLWSIRMMEELKKYDKACFVTFTYDDDHLPSDNRLHKRDIQLFWKRLRKDRKVRYFCCGEYGDRFGRCHFHSIIYGVSPDERDLIEKHWKNGIIHIGNVTEDSCAYVAKYMTKKLRGKSLQEKLKDDPDYQNEFVLMSRRPGIGGDPSPAMIKYMQENGIYWRKGIMSGLPRYYKEKFDIQKTVCDAQDYDDFQKHLTDFEKNDSLIRERIKFFKRK